MTQPARIKIGNWRFKQDYLKSKRLGPIRRLQERRKAERTYELMEARQ